MAEQIAFIAAIILPLWNIPLMLRILKRKSSDDISLYWALGVWVCFVLMAPDGLASQDRVWRMFCVMNLAMFTAVVVTVLAYRDGIRKLFRKQRP